MSHRYFSAFRLFASVNFLVFNLMAQAQPVPSKPLPDTRFGNWLYKKPDATVWTSVETNGNLVFSASEPPGDYCTLTLFGDTAANGDFTQQFIAAVSADQSAKGTVQTEADSGPKPSKAAEGYDVLTRSLRSVTSNLHTYSMYVAGHSADRFDLAAFQTTSEQSWKQYGAQASQFLLSLKLANSLPPEQVAKLLGQAAANDAPALPGFDTPATPVADTVPPNTSSGPPRRPFSFASTGKPQRSIQPPKAIFFGFPSSPFGAISGGESHTLALPPEKVCFSAASKRPSE